MSEQKVRPLAGAEVASHVPGRLRLKLPPEHCTPGVMSEVREKLKAQEGVDEVTVNKYSGSITLRYDKSTQTMEEILRTMQDLDIVVGELAGGSPEEKTESGAPLTLIGAVEDLNERLTAVTGINVNLKTALPVMLAGVGIFSIARNGLRLERIPGLFFLWIALDTFVKLHPPQKLSQSH